MTRARCFQFVLLLFSLAAALPSAVAQVTVATVPAGNSPFGVAVNSITNKTYVANFDDNTVTVIDGTTNNTTTVPVGVYPYAVAVDSATNKIYVANNCGNDPNCANFGTVTVIDGTTNNTTNVTVGAYPDAVAVNSVTNKIYVSNYCGSDLTCFSSGTVTVIDGATNNTVTVNVGFLPEDVEVNAVTNQIYAVNNCGSDNSCSSAGTVSVIDGATNNVVNTVIVGFFPYFAAVNSATNQIYVANSCGNDVNCQSLGTVTDIDGATDNTTTVNAEAFPYGIAVNAITNQIYVANQCGNDLTCNSVGTVTVIDGSTHNTTTVNVGAFPNFVAVDLVTNEVYVPNYCGSDLTCNSAGTVTVINGATHHTVPVAVGDNPQTLAVNATTDRIYVPNSADATVSVIAGDTALQFVSVTPCRLVDTRPQYGGNGPIQGGTFRSFPILQEGGCNIPTTAAAYSLNVTVVPQAILGYLTIWPAGQSRPVVSTLNSLDGRIKADAAIVPAGASGAISVYVTDTTNVILDIDGYFAPVSGSTLAFYPLPPCRVADTRKSTFPQGLGPPHLSGGAERDFPVLLSPCIPAGVNAQAYSFNFTAVPYPALGNPLGYLEVWPKDQKPQHPVSTLNNLRGTIVANAAIVPAGTGGEITAFANNDTDLVIDINGYFAPAGSGGLSLYPAAPCRVIDTRHVGNGQPFSGTLTPPVDVSNGPCGPPAAARAYVFNATVVPQGALGYLTLWPDGTGQPVVSTLNAFDGSLTNNMAIVPSTNGKVDAYAGSGLTQLILDISSYFAP
ncbi:MAG TPA: YncE family protein [Terriglobales bacterium]|jgi:YVTN family beta-propeller protein